MASSQEAQPVQWHYTEPNDHDFQIRGRTVFFVIVLFSVILLFFLLYVYSRWFCRYHRNHFSSDPTSHTPNAPSSTLPQGLDPTSIRSLPITLYKPSVGPATSNGNTECCICLGGYEEGEKVKVLPACHHCFHSECVDGWLVTQSSCPLCRASLLDHSLLAVVVVVVTPNSPLDQ